MALGCRRISREGWKTPPSLESGAPSGHSSTLRLEAALRGCAWGPDEVRWRSATDSRRCGAIHASAGRQDGYVTRKPEEEMTRGTGLQPEPFTRISAGSYH